MEEKNLNDATIFKLEDKELINLGQLTINKHISDIVNPEMMRRLRISIIKFNENSSKLTNKIFWLTIVIGIIALLQLIFLIIRG